MELTEHRSLAIDAYNQAWDLSKSPRTPARDRELLTLAFQSRAHWLIAGGPREHAIADWFVSRIAAMLEYPTLAIDFAKASLLHERTSLPAWLQASLYEGLARAHSANGDGASRDVAIVEARKYLALETDADDAAVIAEQIDELLSGSLAQ